VNFSGVLCGRATWKDAIPIYGKQGVKALEDWLNDQGVKNIKNVNGRLTAAKPWFFVLRRRFGFSTRLDKETTGAEALSCSPRRSPCANR